MSTTVLEPEDYRQLALPRLALLGMLGLAAFLNSLPGVLVLDDQQAVLDNAAIRDLGLSRAAWLSPGPVAAWTLAVNYAVSQEKPWSYHLFNIVIHTLAGLTLFGLVCRPLLRQRDRPRLQEAAPWLAFFVALLWMVHPLQAQSVSHVAGRAECLAGLFYLLTLYGVLRGAEGPQGAGWYALAVVACALGMGSKATAATAPVAALAFDRIYLAGSFAEVWRRRAGLYAGLAACWAVLLLPLLGPGGQAAGPVPDPATYLLTQAGVIVHYLRLAFWPRGLSIDYSDWPQAHSAGDILVPVLVVGVLLGVTVLALVQWPRVGFLGLWFFLTLAPSSFVPSAELAGEERMYLPLAALAALVVLGGFALAERLRPRVSWAPGAAMGLGGLAAAALGGATFLRNADQGSPLELWRDTAAARPHNVRAQLNLGDAYAQVSKTEEAMAAYRAAVEAPAAASGNEYRALALKHLATFQAAAGRADEALRLAAGGAGDPAATAAVLNDVGFALWAQRNSAGAGRFFREAVRLQPGVAKYHFNLALTLHEQGKDKEPEAAAELKEGLRRDPGWPATVRQQAWQKATSGDPTVRNPMQALFLAEQAHQVSPGKRPEVLDTLAAAYALSARYDEAVTTAEEARKLAAAARNTALARAIEERIELYKNRHSFTQGPRRQ
jgi:tetratricopeptide (TPR) repeat protein